MNDIESSLEADSDGGSGTITDVEIIASCSSKDREKVGRQMRVTTTFRQLCVMQKQCTH